MSGTDTVAPRRARTLPRGEGVVRFGAAGFVSALGTGFFYPFSLLFFESLTGLALGTVGAVLTVTMLAALPALPGVGRLVDRVGPRPALIAAALTRTGCFIGFATTSGLLGFAVFSTALALANRTEQAATPVIALGLAPEGAGSRWLALTRVVFNGGMGAGALIAGLLVVDTPSGYVTLALVNAVGAVAAAVLYAVLPPGRVPARSAKATAGRASRVRPHRHLPFLRIAFINAGLWMVAITTESALPVYVLRDLSLPSWTVGALFAVNTVLLTALQLPAGRLLDRFRPSAVLALGAASYAVLYVAAWAIAPAASEIVIAVLMVAMTVYTLGEMAVSQAALIMLTAAPPEEERGAYLAFNQIFVGVATALSPLLATTALSAGSAVLWWSLAAMSLLAATAALRAGRRHRTQAAPV